MKSLPKSPNPLMSIPGPSVSVGVRAKIVIPCPDSRLADPLGINHVGVSERDCKVRDAGVLASAAGTERAEFRALPFLPRPVRTEKDIVAILERVIRARKELLALLGKREHSAVLLKQFPHTGDVARNQGRCELAHQRAQRRRSCGEDVSQFLLGRRQGRQERIVSEQRHDQ